MRAFVVRSLRLVLPLLVLAPVAALALHRQTPFLMALTSLPGGSSGNPHVQGEIAAWVALESTSDLLGNGSAGREIFLFDNNPPRVLHQVTNALTGDSANPATSGNGNPVVFDSSSDLLHRGITARQIFAWDRTSKAFTQLTEGTADSTNPVIDQEGNAVAFQSKADLRRMNLTGTNIYIWTRGQYCDLYGCGHLNAITKGPGVSINPSFSADGGYLAFQSTSPLLGSANGHHQIFVYERRTGRRFQLTAGVGDSERPSMDEHGRLVAFQSTADLLGNGSSGTEIFLLDRQTGVLRQLTNTPTGDSFAASMGSGSRFVSFVSTGDPLGTGPPGQHLYLYDLIEDTIYQVTRSPFGASDNPASTANTIFFFESTEDPLGLGITGRQVYALNVFDALPGRSLGPQTMTLQPGTPAGGGSSVRITTRAGVTTAPIGEGRVRFNVTGRNYDGEAGVVVPAGGVELPPVEVPSFGAVCFTQTGPGQGALDCNGGRADLDVTAVQDHHVADTADPTCDLGCRENEPCQDPLPHPHVDQCPTCLPGTCAGGANDLLACESGEDCPGGTCSGNVCSGGAAVGDACSIDAHCDAQDQCIDGLLGVCNGPVSTHFDGAFGAGAMNLSVPLRAALSVSPGLDQTFCTADDTIALSDVGATLRLTTGVATAGVLDADDTPDAVLGASEIGAPFDCDRLGEKDTSGGRLVGAVMFLDVPLIPQLHDVVLTWRLQADPGPPCTANCPQPCTVDADCADANRCNGAETCFEGSCVPGTPVSCSDNDACNGIEVCIPATGQCAAGVAPNCNDANPCTDDACDYFFGCQHLPDDANLCSDGSLCTTADACHAGSCEGTPLSFDDGVACNGLEMCNPATGLLVPGTPPTCDDFDACTDDACAEPAGCQHVANALAAACPDDGDPCNGVESCRATDGACVQTAVPDCDDANACTTDACNAIQGCTHVPTPAALTCAAGNGDACDGSETCDPGTGACVSQPFTCDDGNPCTADSCDAVLGCAHVPTPAASCDDGNACTTGDSCATGACVGTPAVTCDDGDVCNGAETCDPVSGGCVAGVPLVCDDQLACTTDLCDASLGCRFLQPLGLGGAGCQLAALRAAIGSAPIDGIRGRRLPGQLTRLVEKAQVKVDDAHEAAVARRLELLRAAERRMTRFIRVVINATEHDRIADPVSRELLGLARGVRSSVEGLLADPS